MSILALDPGPTQTAYVLWDGERILDKGIVQNEDLLRRICREEFDVEACVIEMIGHYGTGMPAGAEVFDTCVWIGRFFQAYVHASFDIPTLVKRGKVKLHLCGSNKAKDSNIRQALIDRLGAPGTKKAPGVTYGVSRDVWAALALAVYAHDTAQVRQAA